MSNLNLPLIPPMPPTGIVVGNSGHINHHNNLHDALQKIDDASVVSVKAWGAVGNGVTDDTGDIQDAHDSIGADGATLWFPPGVYVVSDQSGAGVNKYGIKINRSDIQVRGVGATLSRASATAFAHMIIGEPDSDAAPVSNVGVEGLTFDGDNIRHASSGSSPLDYRTAILIRNASNVSIHGNRFEDIDSSAVFCLGTLSGDTVTHVSGLHVHDNVFDADSHATVDRALIHCLHISEVDNLLVHDNQFNWCDVGISGGSTFEFPTDAAGSTYVHATLGVVERAGRGWVFANNVIYNSSEHAIYVDHGINVAITGNTVWTDTPATCISDVRAFGRGVVVGSNRVVGRVTCISAGGSSEDVEISGNNCTSLQVGEGAIIAVEASGISSYVTNRPYLTSFVPFRINIAGNTLRYAGSTPTSVSNATTSQGVRVITNNSNVNFASAGNEYEVACIRISGNTFINHSHAIRINGLMVNNINIVSNIFLGLPLTVTEAAFSGADALDSRAVVAVDNESTLQNKGSTFVGNTVYGYRAIFGKMPATAVLVNAYPAMTFASNHISYTNAMDNGEFRAYSATDSHFAEANGGNRFYATKPDTGSANAWKQTTAGQSLNGRIFRSANAVSVYVDDSSNRIPFVARAVQSFSANDATPSVADGRVFKTANTVPTTITMFDNGKAGQEIVVIIGDANTTIDFTGTNLEGNAGADWTPTTNDHMVCVFDGTNWFCRISDNTA